MSTLTPNGLLDLCESAYHRLGVGGGAFGLAINYAPYLGGLQLTYLAYDGVAGLDGDADADLAILDGRILTNVGPNVLDAAGRAAYPVSIPNVPGLVGFALYRQAAMPSLPALTGAEATVILAQ